MGEGLSAWEWAVDEGITDEVVEERRELRDRRYQELLVEREIEIPGVGLVLATLAEQYSIAIVTTAKRADFELIHRNRSIARYMDFVLTNGDCERSKPAPDPYLTALERFGASADDAVVVEDSARGLRSAIAAGIDCVVVDNEFVGPRTSPGRVLGSALSTSCPICSPLSEISLESTVEGVESVGARTYVRNMAWKSATNDEIDQAFDQFFGLASAGLARVCELIAEVDERQSWMEDGATSLIDWVAAKLRVRHNTASRLVAVSRRLLDLPLTSERFTTGELSFDQVDALSEMATPDSEADLLERATSLSSAALDRIARRRRGLTREDERSVWERRRLVRQWNLDESELRFHGRLPGAEGRVFDAAIDSRVEDMAPNPETGMFDPLQVRAADALTELAATDDKGGGPVQMTVFTDVAALTSDDHGYAELDNTATLSNRTAQRLACDAILESVLEEDGRVIGIGRRSRIVPGWLRRLVYERDGGKCQHPGCRNTKWLQIHHIVPWARGGPTDLDNLFLLCGAHHRWVHERGWHITGPPGKRVFRRPDWTPYPNPRRRLDPRLRELVRST